MATVVNTGTNARAAKNTPEEIQGFLIDIVQQCEREDKEIRRSMMKQWKKNEEFWHGVQYLFWNAKEESWISPVDLTFDTDADAFEQLGSFSDKVVDIFRGHGEAIIAALSAQVPSIRFLPDDADAPDDVLTAQTYNKIADLIIRHNRAKMMMFRSLFFLSIQGLVASYRYKESDYKYGSVEVPVYGSAVQDVTSFTCPECGYTDETDWSAQGQQCPNCGSIEPPTPITAQQENPIVTGIRARAKTRVKIDLYGPTHFKVPYYARNQQEITYLLLYGDLGRDSVMYTYQDMADDIAGEGLDDDERHRFARSDYSSSADDTEEQYLVTVIKAWLRPACFMRARNADARKKLLKRYPSGCRVTLVGKTKLFIEAEEEDLDYRWEIGQSGLATFIHTDPFLRPLVQIQEMRNQLVNLIMETINHGIPSSFADPKVLNFDTYGRFEALPGYIYRAKPATPNSSLGDSFYTSQRSTLSREVSLFLQQLDQDAQFCVGSFPSIYGGPSEGKSRTYAEYAASRQMALQRLSILWSYLVDWFVRTLEGCVKMYAETVVEDEKFTKEDQGNYVNIWIRRSEMVGKVGAVESEASESFPVSINQKKDLVMKLIELNNEFINLALYHPSNRQLLKDVLALNDFKIPGESQRIKQKVETHDLLKSAPIPGQIDPRSGAAAPGQSSIPIDPLVDDHAIHIEEIKEFLADLPGLDAKQNNPEGYANVQAHQQEHQQALLASALSGMASPVDVGTGQAGEGGGSLAGGSKSAPVPQPA